jgi:dienelactone hydrolase
VSTPPGDSTIEGVAGRGHNYEPYGWNHWPDHPWMSFQFRRALGETQAGGGAISECFQAASRMVPGDKESWHTEWMRVADRNRIRAEKAEAAGGVFTARACWLRATNYYRLAEYWLAADDPRRPVTYARCEESFQNAGRWFAPPVEVVEIPYEAGASLPAYFVRSPSAAEQSPVLIAFGGLDSFKEELLFMIGRGVIDRGISCLLVDGPGQGAALRRQGLVARHDFEVPVGRCVDYLETRDDVDTTRIAVSGSSLGGYYATRAAAFEHRLAAAVAHGATWDVNELWTDRGAEETVADHVTWSFGASSMEDAREKARDFRVEGALEHVRCPYLILHGGHDVLGVKHATRVYEYALAHGVDVQLTLVSEEETGAEHCQHDNPTVGMEYLGDWLIERLAISG